MQRAFGTVARLTPILTALACGTESTPPADSSGGAAGQGGTAPLGGNAGAGALGGAGTAGSGGSSGSSAGTTGGATPQAGAGSGGTAGATPGGAAGTGGGGQGGTAGNAGAATAGAGMGGGAGVAGHGGAGAGGMAGSGGAAVESPGCGTIPTEEPATWVGKSLEVDGTARQVWTYLPENYDPARAYPVVFLFHGCGNETNNVRMESVIGEDAVMIRGRAVEDCWDTGTNSPDLAFFDAMVADVEARLCIDTSRRFAVGYSSGSWLINTIECVRGGVLRAAGSVAGGAPRRNDCSGMIARVFVHDLDDNDNDISGSETERDRLLEVNGCDTAAEPVPEDPEPCARYQGCEPGYPVIWCETSGEGHGRQDGLAAEASWKLFSEL
jgi:polyhydroxybutyrate depolymerase